MMGAERKSMVMTEEEKLATAYHEAGHAIVNVLVPGGDPLHKVTIIPRGRALGVTMSLPERDRLSASKHWCEAKIAMCFGGRVAEQLAYGKDHLNSGASGDITQATSLARRMVSEWGMSEKLGPLLYNENQQEVFLGHSVTQRQNVSQETARQIDEEIRRIVTEGEKKAWEVLSAHRDQLEAVTQALMEYRDDLRRRDAGRHARREDHPQGRRRVDPWAARLGSAVSGPSASARGAGSGRPGAAAVELRPLVSNRPYDFLAPCSVQLCGAFVFAHTHS